MPELFLLRAQVMRRRGPRGDFARHPFGDANARRFERCDLVLRLTTALEMLLVLGGALDALRERPARAAVAAAEARREAARSSPSDADASALLGRRSSARHLERHTALDRAAALADCDHRFVVPRRESAELQVR
jgi:hypothetical protein